MWKYQTKTKLVEYVSYKYQGETVYYDIQNVTKFDYWMFEPKKDCFLFRLTSTRTFGMPLVSINLEKNLMYFLKDSDTEDSNWQGRGVKLDFNLFTKNGRF